MKFEIIGVLGVGGGYFVLTVVGNKRFSRAVVTEMEKGKVEEDRLSYRLSRLEAS